MRKPNYPHAPIGDLDKLALALHVSKKGLQTVTAQSNDLFFLTRKIKKEDGSYRLTYDAKPSLKSLHGKICEAFLKRVEYPDYLQGSIRKRDYLTDARSHVGSKVLISEDITNFFPSISKKTVHEMWVGVFGFSNIVAECLAELVTMNGDVVQGAKTSSYICNLVLWNREAQLVSQLRKKGLVYTRYVDDITVSSRRSLSKSEKSRIISSIYSMFRSIGAKPNRRKHKIMPRNTQQDVHGVNVNKDRPTMPMEKRNQIRAAVHRCEIAFNGRPSSSEYVSLFNSVMGKVNTMGRMHRSEAGKLKARLLQVKPVIT
ncbi:reverse transcriptase family protein [Oceanospirillum beijerinckii]|uniref:reverse transcriptase family protein n=1 Tax=Oceanospirillum beijerinckii TaxID=64976 RepID=UPI000413D8AD|nr:reverse transcriptase family protein [Oceanospirillum beijerinckii]